MKLSSNARNKKKITALITLSLLAAMALNTFVNAESTDINSSAPARVNAEQQIEHRKGDTDSADSTNVKKQFNKPKLYFHNREALKSVLNLADGELKSKLAEYDNDIYKLLESQGKVEEYKTTVLKLTKEKLDKAVADGKITQEKADAMYAKAESAMQEFGATEGNSEPDPKNSRESGDRKDGKTEKRTFNFDTGLSEAGVGEGLKSRSADVDFDDVREKLGKAREVFGGSVDLNADNAESTENSVGNPDSERKLWFGLSESSLCEILGISDEELKTKLVESNGNIYKVLEEMGKIDEYKTEVLRTTREALDKAVAEGKITQEKADAVYSHSEEVMNSYIISGTES